MSQELLYTSAPRGLKAGSRGFCTVLSTQGMPAPLATALEGLSGYRPLFPPSDPQVSKNPVLFSHLKMQVVGRSIHLLSRISDYGLDYSQRANKLAHHVVLDPGELPTGGPANLLLTPGFMRDVWTGDPKVVAAKPVRTERTPPTGVCAAWEAATGDAGWAGVVAESFLADPERLVILLFAPGQNVLPLIDEAVSLLPVEARWNVTFSTYFTGLASGTKCAWRAMVRDSKEAHESLRFVNALRIDLTAAAQPRAVGGALVEAARTGLRPTPKAKPLSAPPLPAAAPSTETSDIEFAAAEEPGDVHFQGVPEPPIPLARRPGSPPPIASLSAQRTLNNRIEDDRRRTPKRRFQLVLIVLSVIGLIGAGGGLSAYFAHKNGLLAPIEEKKSLVDNSTSDSPESSAEATSASSSNAPKTSNQPFATNVNAQSIPAPEVPASNDPQINQQPTESNEQNATGSDNSPTKPESVDKPSSTKDEFSVFGVNQKNKIVIQTFTFPNDKPAFTTSNLSDKAANSQVVLPFELLSPRWINWKKKRPDISKKEANLILSFFHPEDQHVADLRVTSDGGTTLVYLLFPVGKGQDDKHLERLIAWCGLDIQESPATTKMMGRFAGTIHIPSKARSLNPSDLASKWPTTHAYDESHKPILRLHHLRLKTGSTKYDANSFQDGVQEFEHEMAAIREKIENSTSTKLEGTPILRVFLRNDGGNLMLDLSLAGIKGESGLLASAKTKLQQEASDYANEVVFKSEKLKMAIRKIGAMDVVPEPLSIISMINNNDIKEEIQKLEKDVSSETNKEAKQINQSTLDGLRTLHMDLPKKCRALHDRFEALQDVERAIEGIRVTSARISYDLFKMTDSNFIAPIAVDLVNFDEDRDASSTQDKPQ